MGDTTCNQMPAELVKRTDSLEALELLYLLSRCRLNPSQAEWMNRAVTNLKAPERFEEIATKTFVAPIAHFHLSKLNGPYQHPALMQKLLERRMQTARNYLFLKSEAKLLSANLLEPAGIPHAFFKGTAFADQFYEEPSMRHARDIDVLIARQHLATVVERGLESGYRLYGDESALSAAERAYHLTIADEISLQSPHGAHIEVHTQLDKTGVLFDTRKILSQTEACDGSGFLRRLPSWLHLIYLCLHHTRHRWSHLHWLADLDAALSNPGYDLAQTKAEAIRLGLWQCVEPCLMLQEASGRPGALASILDGTSNETCKVQDLARASVKNLGRIHRDQERGSGEIINADFVFKWQMTATFRLRYIKRRIQGMIAPGLADYQSSPLGRRIPGLLPMIRVARAVRRRLG